MGIERLKKVNEAAVKTRSMSTMAVPGLILSMTFNSVSDWADALSANYPKVAKEMAKHLKFLKKEMKNAPLNTNVVNIERNLFAGLINAIEDWSNDTSKKDREISVDMMAVVKQLRKDYKSEL